MIHLSGEKETVAQCLEKIRSYDVRLELVEETKTPMKIRYWYIQTHKGKKIHQADVRIYKYKNRATYDAKIFTNTTEIKHEPTDEDIRTVIKKHFQGSTVEFHNIDLNSVWYGINDELYMTSVATIKFCRHDYKLWIYKNQILKKQKISYT